MTPHAALEQWNLKIETAEKIVYLTREMCVTVFVRDIREFKKLRRQLRGKRHIKIELCVKLSFAIIACCSRCTK